MLHILTLVLYLKLSNTLIFTLFFHWYWHCFRGSAGRIFGCLVVRVVFCNCQLLGISIPLGMVHCKSWAPLPTHLCTYWPRTVGDRKQTYKRDAKKQNIINKPDYPFLSFQLFHRETNIKTAKQTQTRPQFNKHCTIVHSNVWYIMLLTDCGQPFSLTNRYVILTQSVFNFSTKNNMTMLFEGVRNLWVQASEFIYLFPFSNCFICKRAMVVLEPILGNTGP